MKKSFCQMCFWTLLNITDKTFFTAVLFGHLVLLQGSLTIIFSSVMKIGIDIYFGASNYARFIPSYRERTVYNAIVG